MTREHTREPWEVVGPDAVWPKDRSGPAVAVCCKPGDAARIVAAVNACASYDDPAEVPTRAAVEAAVGALRRISYAKPDRLDHQMDVAIIERAAKEAKRALAPLEARDGK